MISRELHYLYRKQVRSSHSQHRLRSLAPVSTTTTRHSTTTTQTKTMSHRIGASLGLEPGSYQEAIYDIYVGTVVGAAHIFYFVKRWIIDWVIEPLLWVVGKNKKWKTGTSTDESGSNIDNVQQPDTDKGELKVVGIGFGRTGTYSLTLALDELGFNTLHTQHLYENEEIFEMWTDEIFMPSLKRGHAELGNPKFDVITSNGYTATTDFPMALYVDQIHEQYPNCKFILTTRENSEVWFRSWDTLTKSITAPTYFGGFFITGVRRYSIYLRWLFAIVNKDDSFLTSSRPKMEQYKEAAIESYETHNAHVRTLLPESHLLEYNVKQGWEPLCQFLEIPTASCPTHPFPKTNSARSVQVQAVSAAATPLFLVLFILFVFFTVVFQRVTGKTVVSWVNYTTQVQIPQFLNKMINNRGANDCGSVKGVYSGTPSKFDYEHQKILDYSNDVSLMKPNAQKSLSSTYLRKPNILRKWS